MAPVVLFVVGACSLVLYHFVYDWLAHSASSQKPRKPVDTTEVVKTTVTVLTLVGAVLGGIYAYRKQLLAEGDAHRADASQRLDRYTTAAEQLGHERAAVRLAGVYALARLADDWEEQRQICIDVLCAYLRMPYQPDPQQQGYKEGEREVRRTIISVIGDHLQDPYAPSSWCHENFDFRGAIFDGGELSGSVFLGWADFRDVAFRGPITFIGSTFGHRVTFDGATFEGDVMFYGATFHGMAFFHNVVFRGGRVTFQGAKFSGGHVVFERATFGGSRVDFDGATFTGAVVSFDRSAFSDGSVEFTAAVFSDGEVSFNEATVSGGAVTFRRAEFSGGKVSFDRTAFNSGTVSFEEATVSGESPSFSEASFTRTQFSWGGISRPVGM
ncbi:pentapeptide repeat-containing protein [Streptomyces sp. NPDC046727]|uniref:pentapeptide repeat-containing protein n=1 Tax=Streptomyces sp. NPDC046727 TaxID=3155373 RepID=UPI0033DB0F7B